MLVTIAVLNDPCGFCAAAALPVRESVEINFLHPRLPTPGISIKPVAAACGEPEIALAPQSGGLTRISVGSSCRAGELVSITYADATFVERLDGEGRSKTVLDCFAGEAPITIAFEDGTSLIREPVTDDLTKYSKVAIVWSSSVDLDLHAFEYAAATGEAGHVWSGKPLSFAESEARAKSQKRGHGFLSTASNGTSIGTNGSALSSRRSRRFSSSSFASSESAKTVTPKRLHGFLVRDRLMMTLTDEAGDQKSTSRMACLRLARATSGRIQAAGIVRIVRHRAINRLQAATALETFAGAHVHRR